MQLFATSDKILMLEQDFVFPSNFFKHILGKSIYKPEPDSVLLFGVVIIFMCQGAALEIKADSTGIEKSSLAFVQKITRDWFKSSGCNFSSEMPTRSLTTFTSVVKK